MTTMNEQEQTRAEKLSDRLRAKAGEIFAELMDRNAYAIACELLTATDGTGGFGLKIGLNLIGEKVAVDGKISWSRKFSDAEETEFKLANPNAPTLPGIEEDDETKVTIKTGGKNILTTAGQLRRAGKRTTEGGEE